MAASWGTLERIQRRLGGWFSRIDLEPLSATNSQALLGNLLYVEELPEKGIVKYGKPAGIVACIVPMTNPDLTPAGNASPILCDAAALTTQRISTDPALTIT